MNSLSALIIAGCCSLVFTSCGDVVEVGADAAGGNVSDASSLTSDADPDLDTGLVDASLPADANGPDADPNACVGEGTPCGAIIQCGAPGVCTGFAGMCGQDGSQTRQCVDFTCQGGTCVAGESYDDELACTRNTNGVACGSTTSCGTCTQNAGSICTQAGSRTCTTTNRECSAGSCQNASTSQTSESCSFNTDGEFCSITTAGCPGSGVRPVCCSGGSCTQNCGSCEL